jgi:hypothetical protein
MRVALVLVSMLVATTSSQALNSCMSKARHHFGSVHIYRHGPDHCWDAGSTGRREANGIRQNKAGNQPRWRQAMSEVSPDSEPAQVLEAHGKGGDDGSRAVADSANSLDRWVEIVRAGTPPPRTEPPSGPTGVSPILAGDSQSLGNSRIIILAFLAVVMMLAIIEVLYRNNGRQR